MTMKAPPQTPKGHRPQVFDDPAVDQLYAAYVTLCTELAVAFDKIAALETALQQTGTMNRSQLEEVALAQSMSPERMAQRAELAERLLRPFKAFRDVHIAAASNNSDESPGA